MTTIPKPVPFLVGTQAAEPVSTSVTVGLTLTEKRALVAAAKKAGLSTSAWARRILTAAVK